MEHEGLDDRILDHLRTIAHTKRALLQIAVDVADDYPTQANTLIYVIASLTRSADMLLGDTQTL